MKAIRLTFVVLDYIIGSFQSTGADQMGRMVQQNTLFKEPQPSLSYGITFENARYIKIYKALKYWYILL